MSCMKDSVLWLTLYTYRHSFTWSLHWTIFFLFFFFWPHLVITDLVSLLTFPSTINALLSYRFSSKFSQDICLWTTETEWKCLMRKLHCSQEKRQVSHERRMISPVKYSMFYSSGPLAVHLSCKGFLFLQWIFCWAAQGSHKEDTVTLLYRYCYVPQCKRNRC